MTDSSDDPMHSGYNRLLIPVDLTTASDRVLGRVALLPLARDARLTLLHVVPSGLPARDQRRVERSAKTALTEEARHLAKSLPREVTVEPIVTVGAAASEIAERSKETKAEMIVMGRVGSRPLRDTVLGSTAERVLRRSRIPVLAVRLPPRAPYRRPAVALDVDEAAGGALAQLLEVIPAPRPRVTVIHAYDAPFRGLVYSRLSEDDAEEYLDHYRHEAAQKIGELIAAAMVRAKTAPADAPIWKTHIQFGSPRTIIEKTVKKAETDLLVLGTRGRAGLAYAFLGTVAGDVLRAVSCDVLVVPPSSRR